MTFKMFKRAAEGFFSLSFEEREDFHHSAIVMADLGVLTYAQVTEVYETIILPAQDEEAKRLGIRR